MERGRDESGIPNKHFINALSFKLNIKQNKIHLAKTSMLPCRFKVPCSQSIGPKNSKTSKDAVKYLSAEVGEIEKLFMGQILEKSHFGGGGETVRVEYATCFSRARMRTTPVPSFCGEFNGGRVLKSAGCFPLSSEMRGFLGQVSQGRARNKEEDAFSDRLVCSKLSSQSTWVHSTRVLPASWFNKQV